MLILDVMAMSGLPGEIQFVDPLENKKLASFKVVRRHLTTKVGDIDPDPLAVSNVIIKIINGLYLSQE